MTKQQLAEILQNGESSTVEFKTEDVHPNSLAEEIVAFANLEGGKIFLGIGDDGDIEGCTQYDIEEFVVNVCRNNIRPSLIPVIEKIRIEGKLILIMHIAKGDTVYATNRGRYYIRVGSTRQLPTQQELLRLFQKKNILQFDETPVLKASPTSIDLAHVNAYLVKLDQSPIDDESEAALMHELVNLSILTNIDDQMYPALGGLLAFGKHPQKYFPSYTVTCGAYRGHDFLSESIQEKELHGTLDTLIEDAIAFLKLTMPQQVTVDRDIRQETTYRYPIIALREGIVNAVCHRDYTITGSAIRIFLFQDRLEIRSPGGLPNTLTLENMHYRQFTRNQMIASFLSGYGYMERRGKGILRMVKACEQQQIDCNFFITPDESEFVVTYRPNNREPE